jgi:hypothetical protein
VTAASPREIDNDNAPGAMIATKTAATESTTANTDDQMMSLILINQLGICISFLFGLDDTK